MRIKFLKNTITNKQFNYSPIYYDERKEKLEQKKAFYRRAENGDLTETERREQLRNNLKSTFNRAEYRQKATSTSNLRVFVLIFLLFALGYFIFNGVDQVDSVVEKMWD